MFSQYECDGQTSLTAFNTTVPIPFPAGLDPAHPEPDVPPPNMTRTLRKGYYASVTYTDWLVGRLLNKLVELRHDDDTVVALIGDHGWQVRAATSKNLLLNDSS